MVTRGDETKAAVLAALMTGQSVNSIAKEYQIPRTTIMSWRDKAGMSDMAMTVTDSKKDIIGELLFDYLREALVTLRFQAEQFRDTNWLKRQNASEIAVLHGVITDKAIRILEAAANAEQRGDNTADQP